MAELRPDQKAALTVLFTTGKVVRAAESAKVDTDTIHNWRQLEAWKVEWTRLEKQQERDLAEMVKRAATIGVTQLIYVAQGKTATGKKDDASTPAARATAATSLVKISGIQPPEELNVNINSLTKEEREAKKAAILERARRRGESVE